MAPPNGITSPPDAPSLADPANFAQQAAAFVAWIANFVENEWENLDPDVFFAVQSGLDALEAGFLMPVGAFGLGTSLAAGNVDDRHTSGFYFGYGGAHASASAGVNPFPDLDGPFVLQVNNHALGGAGEYIWQKATKIVSNGPVSVLRVKTTDGAGWTAWGGEGFERGTEQATTSGTAIDWTGLPAGINELTLHLDAVSLSGTDGFLVQLGTSGGFVTSGYVANAATIFGSSAGEALSTSGVPITNIGASEALNGHLTFKRMDGDKWTASGSFGNSTGSYFSSGKIDLGAELTQIRLTRSGSDTFDAGAANISWRY
ncbi:hypothetical protein [uncultured Ruegeria sp.]|uniref:hypothetical protein n=1 Tax=uncultured Ruegeria sp. TaxID=259304 RepID=UPI002638E8DF|nr:hypothetical protein [uncultured Ruegeria sp.]